MTRVADHSIDPLFLHRWSPRAMSGQPMEKEELFRLFEAARWAPSSGNNQPWRFLYGCAGTPAFATFFELLAEGNRVWCQRAGALVVVASKTTRDNGKPARTHSYDAGAAWMSLALQASLMGLVVHGMEGFDYDLARTTLEIPAEYQVEAMIAIGHPGRAEDLPEKYRAIEAPNSRHPIEAHVFEQTFGNTPK
jgi:nitroreductase